MSKFRLDSVIKVRQIQERKFKQDLSRIKVIRENAEKILEELELEKKSQIQNLENDEKMKAIDLQMQYAYLNAIAEEVERQRIALEKIISEENDKRNLLIRTNQSKKMLEKLKTKFIEEKLKELQKSEQNTLDSISHRTTLNR